MDHPEATTSRSPESDGEAESDPVTDTSRSESRPLISGRGDHSDSQPLISRRGDRSDSQPLVSPRGDTELYVDEDRLSPPIEHGEVDKMFHAGPRFSIHSLTDEAVHPSEERYGETDFRRHRHSFPHVHHPLSQIVSRSSSAAKKTKKKVKKAKRKYPSKSAIQSPTIIEAEESGSMETDSESETDDDDEEDYVEYDDAPELYENEQARSQGRRGTRPSIPDVNVGFYIGEDQERSPTPEYLNRRRGSSQGFRGDRERSPTPQSEYLNRRRGSSQGFRDDREHSPTPQSEYLNKRTGSSQGYRDDREYSPTPQPEYFNRRRGSSQGFRPIEGRDPQTTPMFGVIGGDPMLSEQASLNIPGISSRRNSGANMSSPKVSFHIGGDGGDGDRRDSTISRDGEAHHLERRPSKSDGYGHKHKHRHKENYGREHLLLRRQRGSEVKLGSQQIKRVATEEDEASMLQSADLDEMTSHRFEDQRGRRHKFNKRTTKDKKKMPKLFFKDKAKYDHRPHEVFVELDQLHVNEETEEWEWREKARWIKFEEDVEEGAGRWGKPHVASLSFNSLIELRKVIENGVMMLDLEAPDFSSIIHYAVDSLVIHDHIKLEHKGIVLKTLLLKHKHVDDRSNSVFLRRNVSYMNLMGLDGQQRQRFQKDTFIPSMSAASFGSAISLTKLGKLKREGPVDDHKSNDHDGYSRLDMLKLDIDNNMTDGKAIVPPVQTPDQQRKQTQDIMKRIPVGAEATTVLVGELDFLEKPAVAFIRLAEGQLMGNVTEVPLPVRFVFIILGPSDNDMDYLEVGRSISTLMSNQNFHDVAYKADHREEFLHAINEFLNESIVLPPGDWDQKTLLPIMDMARKRNNARRRKKKKQDEKAALLDTEAKVSMDPFKRTGRIFGGVINDVKRRYPFYAKDFKDAMNGQSLAAFVFIFFACVAPCIAFGAILGEKTHGLMGVTETILSTSFCGVIFGLFCGQPLLLLGPTGPVLVYEQSLYQFCENNGIEFLPFRIWVGIWVAVICTVVVALEGGFLIRVVTRFTEEIFAILISLIFIYEVIKKFVKIFKYHPLLADYCDIDSFNGNDTHNATWDNHTDSVYNSNSVVLTTIGTIYHSVSNYSNMSVIDNTHQQSRAGHVENMPNTALLSTILCLGTFLIAYFLKIFRNSKFLGRTVRRALGDFGVLIALVLMVLVDFLIPETYTQKLDVPVEFGPTNSSMRGWFINPMGVRQAMPIWQIFAAIIPAFLVFILIFMEVEITEMILNKKSYNLKKGSGYHIDVFITCLLVVVCSLFGLPWMCAATVRSVVHVSALSVMSRTHAPGEKPKLLYIIEQRFTNIAVSALIGLCLAVGPLLRQIPIATLFGVFMYLGVSSMSGIHMFERTKLLLMPVKHHPSVGFVRRVRTWKMHLYTGIQISCLIVLWIVKSTAAALAFPFLLMMLIPVRSKAFPLIFTKKELHELDKEEEDSEDDDDEDLDFYAQVHMPI